MLQIPAQLTNHFTTYIGQKGIPSDQHRYYLKWLRYYLDFCHKYEFRQGTVNSLSAFLKKLDDKRQPAQLQNQAEKAVRFYFACVRLPQTQQVFSNKDRVLHPSNNSPNTYSDGRQENKLLESVSRQVRNPATKYATVQEKGTDWSEVFAELNNAISVRHYSRATLKPYIG